MARLGRAAAAMAGDLAAAAALDLDAAELPWPRQGGLPADGGRVALRDARARLPPWAVAVLPGDDGDFDDVDDELEAPEPGAVEDLMQVFRARWGAPAGEEAPGGGAGHARPPRRPLPDLSALTALTGLNLSDNELSTIPPVLLSGCLKSLRAVDLSSNGSLQIADGAGGLGAALLAALPSLRVLDLRAVHAEAGLGYWSAAKCSTMSALAGLAKAAKRKGGGPRILFDTD